MEARPEGNQTQIEEAMRQDLENFPGWQQMENVDTMGQLDFDKLPFGAIQLDERGKVLRYNHTESKISGRSPQEVIGKDFFSEVAPCTNVQLFAGQFREGVARKELNVTFPYRFDFRMQPTDVWVRLFFSQATQSAWVFVSQRKDPL